jgi:hypothetical protein
MNIRSIPALIAAALFGLLIWLSANLRETYVTTVTVPVAVDHLPAGWAIRTPVPRTLLVRLRGEGWQLATMLIGKDLTVRFPVVPPDVSASTPAAVAAHGSRVVTMREVAERIQLLQGVELVSATPDSIVFELDRFVEKRVPVVVDYAMTFREGYGQSGQATLLPDSVLIGGAESILRTISSWKTERGTFSDVKSPIEANLALAPNDRYDIALSTRSVHVSINVQPFAEKVLNGLAVEIAGVPPQREVIFIPPRVEIVVRGGIRQLANLSHGDFHVGIDYTTILTDTTGIVEPVITGPADVQVVRKRPERLQYIVRKRL